MDHQKDLLADAGTLFGYGVATSNKETLCKVALIFKKLGIVPFSNRSVFRYKRSLVNSLNAQRYSAWYWADYELGDYKREVPLFALSRAVELQKVLKAEGISANFHVEEVRKEKRVRDADPFMYVRIARRNFYLDVWNEPKFEGRRTK